MVFCMSESEESHLIVSEPCIVVPESIDTKPLGNLLQEADLVSSAQVEVALQDQNCYYDLRIGEILSLRGWLKQKTADFFVQQWPLLVQKRRQQPLGFYLQAAGLLDEEQIRILLSEQAQIGLRVGALAVLKGWLKPTTLEFFLKYLCPEHQSESPFVHKENGACLAKDTLVDDTLTEGSFDRDKDTLNEVLLERETFLEPTTGEDFFDFDEETFNEDTPTQIIDSSLTED
ncbi:MAG: hypothetical protein HC784_14610 [Hydrococcus sp. CSU_1_8]|nr:hypothetical protein [Hydrococcus sp. CSU_1_8]